MKNVLKFQKSGRMRFVGHLDLLRAFQRLFRKCGVELKYSQGFNPHPQISFASPLPLGYNGMEELLEFETVDPIEDPEGLVRELNTVAPQGIVATTVVSYDVETRRPMGELLGAIYTIEFPDKDADMMPLLQDFLNQPEIWVTKTGKVNGRKTLVKANYRPLINGLNFSFPSLTLNVKMTPEGSFNPTNFLEAFYDSIGKEMNYDISVTRQKLLFKD